MATQAEIERHLSMSREELLKELGQDLPDDDFYGYADARERALAWLEARRGQLYEIVCHENRWPRMSDELDEHPSHEAVVAAVDGWLAPHFGNLPVLTIAALLVRDGLDSLCGT